MKKSILKMLGSEQISKDEQKTIVGGKAIPPPPGLCNCFRCSFGPSTTICYTGGPIPAWDSICCFS